MFARTPFAPTLSPAAFVAGPGGRASGYPCATPSGHNSNPPGPNAPTRMTRQSRRQQEEAEMRFDTTPAAVTPVVLAIEVRAAWHLASELKSDARGADPRRAACRLDSI